LDYIWGDLLAGFLDGFTQKSSGLCLNPAKTAARILLKGSKEIFFCYKLVGSQIKSLTYPSKMLCTVLHVSMCHLHTAL